MLRYGFAVLTSLFLAFMYQQPPVRDVAAHRALQRLQGTWQQVSGEIDGVAVPADRTKNQTLFIGVDSFLIRDGDKQIKSGNLQLDPSASPATLNAIVKQGQQKGTTLLGIYAIQGNTLKVCFDPQGQNRPKDFKSEAGSGMVLVSYERTILKTESIDITGNYKAESTSIDGRVLESTAVIERRGDAYLVTFKKDDNLIFAAMGIRHGDHLSLSWGNRGQIGVSAYKIEPGPKLVGQYTTVGGPGLLMKEVLTAEKRID